MTPSARPTAAQRGYNARWRRYRERYLTQHPFCVFCERAGRVSAATVVDHIRPHKGNHKLFWDPANHQPLCKVCHDTEKHYLDRDRGSGHYRGCAADGTPLDPGHHWR